MSLLRDIERRVERLVERGFRRTFRSTLQPVELARKLAREMDDHKTVSVSRVYVPNEYTVYLSPPDRQGFASYEQSLVEELSAYLAAHARGQGLSLVTEPVVRLEDDGDLRPGEFGIACRMADPPPSERPAPAAAPAVPSAPPAPVRHEALEGVSGTQIISAEDAREAGIAQETMTLVVDGRRTRLSKRVSSIGRSRDCDVVVPDPNVSRTHAEVRHIGMDYFLIDAGSTNGLTVNGQRVKRHALADGDVIVMGTTEIRVELA